MSKRGQLIAMPVISQSDLRHYLNMQFKQRREQMAYYYRDNPNVTIQDVALKFGASPTTVKKALAQFGVATDHQRGVTKRTGSYTNYHCPKCQERFRHYCREVATLEEQRDHTPSPAQEDPDEFTPPPLYYKPGYYAGPEQELWAAILAIVGAEPTPKTPAWYDWQERVYKRSGRRPMPQA